MEQRQLGRTRLQVSRLALGTWTWGQETDIDDAAGQIKTFLDAGGTLVDATASADGAG
jgi:aryl-alcohol dehydrogenase-like predicted oxidoreductase